jgi:uncharacterized protein VirK/YbjX
VQDSVIKGVSGTGGEAAGTGQLLRLIVQTAREIHPGVSVVALKRRAWFVCRALTYRRLLREFCVRVAHASSVVRSAPRSDVLGVTEWPYLNNAWSVAERLDRIASHYEFLASCSGTLLCLDPRDALRLVDLSALSGDCAIVIDRAHWFKREGELVLNLFKSDLRVASLVFTLGSQDGVRAIFVGAMQGIHQGVSSERSLAIFKELTKEFEGLRPRSLLVETLKMIGNRLHISRLLAVADENRHHHHKYFGATHPAKLSANYNEIWIEHGGVPSTVVGFYEIPLAPHRKDVAEIPARKRAMYRRRYAILTQIEQEIASKLG